MTLELIALALNEFYQYLEIIKPEWGLDRGGRELRSPTSIDINNHMGFLVLVDFYWMIKHPTKPKAIGLNIIIIGTCILSPLSIYFVLTRVLFLIPDFFPFLPPDGMEKLHDR